MSKGNNNSLRNKLRRIFFNRSLILKYFITLLVLEFAIITVLGVSFSLLGQGEWATNRIAQMSENVRSVADSTSQLIEGKLELSNKSALFMLCNNIKMISQAINADIYVCNLNGEVVICKDLIDDDYTVNDNGTCVVHSVYKIPQSVIDRAVNGGFSEKNSTLDGVYSRQQLIC